MIGGLEGSFGSAMKDFLASLGSAMTRFFNAISRFFNEIYYAIPREYVLAGLTILVLGIALMIYISRPRR